MSGMLVDPISGAPINPDCVGKIFDHKTGTTVDAKTGVAVA